MRTNCTKKAYLLSVALLPLFPAKAQFHIGIKTGIVFASVSVKPATTGVNYSTRRAGTGGLFAYIPIHKKWSIRPETMLTGKGAKASARLPLHWGLLHWHQLL
ncbi:MULTISPECIES: porin family protein [Niastella]|uniref:Outer membrane protein beta-barrel domain-containing protein n=1 Tax=Niastella soli TaxID=2821487 RepID=A0ABS3YSE0_9BACT|nr:hypothetical protein [Niastella soli]MBO9200834.1 hypothetical protein [Niastella soli]